ncbi:DUF1877 family protein [Gordonia zhaorongruii]|uniref:DUF1877 family protein n=1 Tax=Gordonia zhaorongruii TaxID=2597659 RepID=UPI0014044854|nr:DUF1877 family protein [Gordonia zhaorongruii]
MLSVYLAVPTGADERLATVDPDGVIEYVEGLLESGVPSIDLGEAWDGLHFLLTGASASEPIEDEPLSEAVVGVYEFESDDLLGLTPAEDLPFILARLETVNIEQLLAGADFATFAKAEIYPDRWTDEPESLRALLREAFTNLIEFHRYCRAESRDLLVSIH